MSADRLAEIKARADAATKGPWHWREGEPTSLVHVTSPRMHPWNILKAPDWGPTLADAEFIAAAREDVPWLVERVERLERWKAEALGIIDYRGEQQQRAEDERDNALAEVARLTAERDALAVMWRTHTDLRPAIEARVAELDAQAKSTTTEADTLPVGGEA